MHCTCPGVNYPKVDALVYEYLDKLGGHALMQHASVGIIGSAVPWYEALALAFGAADTLTIEYNQVHYGDSRMKAMSPGEYWSMPDGARPRFDVAFSISSFEHDGLGRYGDPLNPDADLEAMAEMERVVVDGGLLLLAVPVGAEALIWNAHRVYGRKRLAMLLHRWRVLHRLSLTLPDMTCLHDIPEAMFDRRVYAPEQPLFVLQNTRPEGITGISHASLDIE